MTSPNIRATRRPSPPVPTTISAGFTSGTVLRDGRVIGTHPTREVNRNELVRMMVGREVHLELEKAESQPGERVLVIENLVVADDTRQITVDGLSLEVRGGEVLGVAGVQGNGQRLRFGRARPPAAQHAARGPAVPN